MTDEELKSFILRLFFLYAWKKRPKYCECGCGRYLPREINKCTMDHLEPKSVYPEYAYAISNIMFVTPECHTNRENGFPNEKQKRKLEWAKENHELFEKEHNEFIERVSKKLNI